MTGFIVGALVLLTLTLCLLAWPLMRRSRGATVSSQQLTATVYRDKLAELDQDLAAGSLSSSDHAQSRAELQRRLIEDSAEPASVPAHSADPQAPRLFGVLSLLLPLAALGLYLFVGSPAALNIGPNPHPQGVSSTDIEKMVSGLAAKLEKEPDNVNGWAMLARSYKTLGRFEEASKAYARTGPLLDANPDLLVDYADSVAAAAKGFNEESRALVERALKIDPNHPLGLWMRGSASFDAGRFDRAIADWEKLLAQLPPDSEDVKAIQGNLAEARRRAAAQ